QKTVRTDLAHRGIVVEINPSSNLLIGNLGDLTKHPLWRICPPGTQSGDRLRVCIGSDDPVTFATRLPEEYQLLWDAMVDGNISAYAADEWIEKARQTGTTSRFTVKRSTLPLRTHLGLNRIAIIP